MSLANILGGMGTLACPSTPPPRSRLWMLGPFRSLEPGEGEVHEAEFTSPSGLPEPVLVERLFFSDDIACGRDEEVERLSSVGTMFTELFGETRPDPHAVSHNARRRALRERRRRLRLRAHVVIESISVGSAEALVHPLPGAVLSQSAHAAAAEDGYAPLGPLSTTLASSLRVAVRNVGTWRSQPFNGAALIVTRSGPVHPSAVNPA